MINVRCVTKETNDSNQSYAINVLMLFNDENFSKTFML